jgi:hypothetical protein
LRVILAARLGASLEEFAGHPAYGIGQLREDLERFVFLLGSSDDDPLFGPAPHQAARQRALPGGSSLALPRPAQPATRPPDRLQAAR